MSDPPCLVRIRYDTGRRRTVRVRSVWDIRQIATKPLSEGKAGYTVWVSLRRTGAGCVDVCLCGDGLFFWRRMKSGDAVASGLIYTGGSYARSCAG